MSWIYKTHLPSSPWPFLTSIIYFKWVKMMMKNLASWNNLASITYLWIALRSKSSGTNFIVNKGPPESPGQVPELEPGTLAQNIEGSLNFLGRSFSTCSYSASNDWRLYRLIDIKRTHFICITVFLTLLHTPSFLLEIRVIIKISSHPWYHINCNWFE